MYLVYTDGTIIEYKVGKNSSLQKTYQTKVASDHCGYFAFVDKFGGLNIGSGNGSFYQIIDPMTKRRQNYNSMIVPSYFDVKSVKVVVGPYLWILGGSEQGCSTYEYNLLTSVENKILIDISIQNMEQIQVSLRTITTKLHTFLNMPRKNIGWWVLLCPKMLLFCIHQQPASIKLVSFF